MIIFTFKFISYFFARYSAGDTYSIIDLSKTVFIFIVSIFSVSFVRLQKEKSETEDFNFSDFLKKIKGEDFGYFMVAFIVSVIADYGLFKLYDISTKNSGGPLTDKWIYGMLFLFRMYVPLILFSLAN